MNLDLPEIRWSYTPLLNKKCRPLVLKDNEDIADLLTFQFDNCCKIPLGVTVEPMEVFAMTRVVKIPMKTRMVCMIAAMLDFMTITST